MERKSRDDKTHRAGGITYSSYQERENWKREYLRIAPKGTIGQLEVKLVAGSAFGSCGIRRRGALGPAASRAQKRLDTGALRQQQLNDLEKRQKTKQAKTAKAQEASQIKERRLAQNHPEMSPMRNSSKVMKEVKSVCLISQTT